MNTKPYIARDTGKPLVVLGGYSVAISGGIIPEFIPPYDGSDYGHDPIPEKPGYVKMFPSGDVVTIQEARKRLGRSEW